MHFLNQTRFIIIFAGVGIVTANTWLGRFSGEGECGTVRNPQACSSAGCYAIHSPEIDCNQNVVQECAQEGSGWNGEGYADTCGRQVVLINNNPDTSPLDHIADVQDVNTKAIVGKCFALSGETPTKNCATIGSYLYNLLIECDETPC